MLAIATSAIATIAALAAGYQSMAPTGQWYGKTFTGLSHESRKLALTYDDGPNDPHTLRLLEVLAKHNVQASFFLIGRYVQQRTDLAREIDRAGHIIGIHTYTHPLLIFKSESEVRHELSTCRTAIEDAIGKPVKFFRPPFGGRRPAVLRIANELNLKTIMWNVTGYDWNAPPAQSIEQKVAKKITGGNIILLHDGGHKEIGADRSQTIIATDNLITRFKEKGYEFATIPNMIGKK